jgi:PKD repeat protein
MSSKFQDRISTLDPSYVTGDLSLYPKAIDSQNELYVVANNASTTTTQSTPYSAKYFAVSDTSSFPSQGLLQIGTELVYYYGTTPNQFTSLVRGFAGSRQNQWPMGTSVLGVVGAETHNAIKDAVLNIETNLGTSVNPTATSLNGLLTALETKFLAPRPVFIAAPKVGSPPLIVTFQNFSSGPGIRYFWEFGDGAVSTDFAPMHTYLTEGSFTVTLNMITVLGAQGIATKSDYIQVNTTTNVGFFYVTPLAGDTNTVFSFVDQTDGDITSRYWVWGDGNSTTVLDSNVHYANYQYTTAGTYNPSLLLVFSDETKQIVKLGESITVMPVVSTPPSPFPSPEPSPSPESPASESPESSPESSASPSPSPSSQSPSPSPSPSPSKTSPSPSPNTGPAASPSPSGSPNPAP